MIKSLYMRVVLTFLAVILAAIVCASLAGLLLFQRDLNALQQEEMRAAGEHVLSVYEQAEAKDLERFIRDVSALSSYPVRILSETDHQEAYKSINDTYDVRLTLEAVQKVLGGEIYQAAIKAEGAFIGLPIQFQDEPYALILLSSSRNEGLIIRLFLVILGLVLLAGSLFILFAAGYLVKPLQKLTSATRRLAKGDFDVALRMKRRDEIGTLAESFNEMAKELKELETMRGDFVASVSHEIQTPLTSISGFARTLRHGKGIADEKRDRYLDIIVAESERLSRLGDNLLALASLESSRHPFEARTFHLDEQIRSVVVACEPQWSAKSIQLDVDLGAAASITADEDQLKQVWLNVLGNSIKFTPEGGRIDVSLSSTPAFHTITWTDTGQGMSPEELSRIFERFYKADRSRSGSGNGLGLAIVHKIVEYHYGEIEVRSQAGQGTAVIVRLPVIPPSRG
ncbi:HAMP domain-containing protein [Paenibacillus pinisoli]|uniref:Heme sensor protein HssS n=1 Tax=Paenibacillus pinisoli TaxID=1276110 RepID=A0A3A6PBR4_9BACL|nr:HAMP domain-containing sensor histidine kinase [Paenibacillus pinisoli]RJX37136.1 HAMP domain-containing protein [Paenibacillus pinisoli]